MRALSIARKAAPHSTAPGRCSGGGEMPAAVGDRRKGNERSMLNRFRERRAFHPRSASRALACMRAALDSATGGQKRRSMRSRNASSTLRGPCGRHDERLSRVTARPLLGPNEHARRAPVIDFM